MPIFSSPSRNRLDPSGQVSADTAAMIARYSRNRAVGSGGRRGGRGKIGTLRIIVHNFDIINVKKKLQLGFISINSLARGSRIKDAWNKMILGNFFLRYC